MMEKEKLNLKLQEEIVRRIGIIIADDETLKWFYIDGYGNA